MHVAEGEDVGSDSGLPGLLGSGEGEGAWDEETGGGVGGRRWSVRVEGAAVVFGRAELVSVCRRWC